MAKYNKELTDKQKEALEPLWQRGKENRRKREKLQRRITLEQLFFEESKDAHNAIDELDKEYADISMKISEIYGVQEELANHMKIVISEIKKVEAIAKQWGIKIYD